MWDESYRGWPPRRCVAPTAQLQVVLEHPSPENYQQVGKPVSLARSLMEIDFAATLPTIAQRIRNNGHLT